MGSTEQRGHSRELKSDFWNEGESGYDSPDLTLPPIDVECGTQWLKDDNGDSTEEPESEGQDNQKPTQIEQSVCCSYLAALKSHLLRLCPKRCVAMMKSESVWMVHHPSG